VPWETLTPHSNKAQEVIKEVLYDKFMRIYELNKDSESVATHIIVKWRLCWSKNTVQLTTPPMKNNLLHLLVCDVMQCKFQWWNFIVMPEKLPIMPQKLYEPVYNP